MTVTVDVTEAPAIIDEMLKNDRLVEVQWVEGLTVDGEEYGKFVTEDICGYWGDEMKFNDLETFEDSDYAAAYAWIVTNLPKYGDVRIVYV